MKDLKTIEQIALRCIEKMSDSSLREKMERKRTIRDDIQRGMADFSRAEGHETPTDKICSDMLRESEIQLDGEIAEVELEIRKVHHDVFFGALQPYLFGLS